MAFELMEEVKKHPVPAALIAGGVVLGFLYITGAFSSGGQAATTTGGLDPATAQLYAQTQAIQAQQQGQAAQIAGQQNLASTQASYGLSLAQIQANAQTTNTNTAASVALAQIAAAAQTSQESVAAQLQAAQDQYSLGAVQINDQLAGLESTNALSAQLSTINANEQVQVANINANTQVNNANLAYLGLIGQQQTQLGVANINASVAKTQSNNALTGQYVGAATSLLGAAFGL